MKRSSLALSAVVLTCGLALSACGGNNDSAAKPAPTASSSSVAATISEADFTEQANAICAAGNADIQTAADAIGATPTKAQIEGFATDTLVPNIQAQHDDIEALGTPDGAEASVGTMLAALQTGVDALKSDPSIINGETDPFGPANDAASQLGLTDCTG